VRFVFIFLRAIGMRLWMTLILFCIVKKVFPELTAKYDDFCNQIPDCFHGKFRNDKFSVSE